MERRAFIKSSCGVCVLAASGLLVGSLTGCSPAAYPVFKTAAVNHQIAVPLALFEQNQLQVVRAKELFFDIAIQKKNSNEFTALLLQCTHQDNALSPIGNGYHCSLHGSEFDKNGAVTKGPAEQSLKKYQTSIEGNSVIIHI